MMKKMKKLLSLALACMMALSMVTAASADEVKTYADVTENVTNNVEFDQGTISIDGIHKGADESDTSHSKYDVYKMLHLESYDAAKESYSYRVVKEWVDFFKTGAGAAYMDISDMGYATWKDGVSKSDEVVAEFAKKALEYAKANDAINPVMTTETGYRSEDRNGDGEKEWKYGYQLLDTTGTFYGLTLGYYLVDSNVGALCGLSTTQPHADIIAKNGAPTLEKKVKEDSTNEYGSSNTADVGQLVEFQAYVKVHAGAQNYIFHDVMTEGLTFKEVVSVDHTNPDTPSKSLGVLTPDKSEGYYEIKTDLSDGCTFEIVFSKTFCDSMEDNDYFYIYYTATLNENALNFDKEENTATLTYGENSMHTTTPSKTETYTYGFDLLKTNSSGQLLGGTKTEDCAVFELYDASNVTVTTENGVNSYTYGEPMQLVRFEGDDGSYVYRVLMPSEVTQGVEGVTSTIVTNGRIRIDGIDNGVYYLKEIQAPSGGYNMLSEPHKITISGRDQFANYDSTGAYTGPGIAVAVQNSTGSVLPSTGAKGTAMFIGFGAALVIGTGLLLVTKKRMAMIED